MTQKINLNIFAHRGASTTYPENTMLAFYQAYLDGADGIELDVHLTKDQHIVVIHDESIDRTSTGQGQVNQMTLQQLRQYNYCGEFGHQYSDTWFDIPLLEDVLKFLSSNDLLCNIELKTDIIHYHQIETKVVDLVAKYGLQHRTIYSSFNIESLICIHELDNTLNTAILTDTLDDLEHKLKITNANGIHLDYKVYQMSLASLNYPIRLWTINDILELEKLSLLSIDTIMTDTPKQFIDILNMGGLHNEAQ